MNIKLLLADSDTVYAQRLFNSLSSDARFTVAMFTDKDKMVAAVKTKQYDIVLYNNKMSDAALGSIGVKAMLCDPEINDVTTLPGSFVLNKYQRISNIIRELMDKYSEITPNSASFGSKPVKMLAFYSPTGGSGKTTLAIAAALSAANEGLRALYLDFETYSSVNAFMKTESDKGLSEIFGKLYTDINFSAKLQSLLLNYKGVSYLDGFTNVRDISEITEEDIDKFVNIITQANLCDVLIIDLDSSFSTAVSSVLKLADRVMLVADNSSASNGKLKCLERQYGFLSLCEDKLKLLSNKGARAAFSSLQNTALVSKYASDDPFEISMAIAAGKEMSTSKLLS